MRPPYVESVKSIILADWTVVVVAASGPLLDAARSPCAVAHATAPINTKAPNSIMNNRSGFMVTVSVKGILF
jgi:hypothetical protein